MADEIINRLGFDVAQALSALQQFDSQLQTSATALQAHAAQLNAWNSTAQAALATMRALASASAKLGAVPGVAAPAAAAAPAAPTLWLPPGVQTQAAQATQQMSKLASVSVTAGTAMTNAGNSAAGALAGANEKAKLFSVSWSMMGRIIITQAIVRALSQIRNALKDAVVAAIAFQKQIAEIEVISPPTAYFTALQDEVAELSKRFNIPLPQVAEGLYQTISDQFVQVGERAKIMQAALKLARVAVMDAGSAVELLTGTLNAYGMSADNAEIVAAKFFETIKLGRVRGEELAATIGQVIPIAAQVGVSLDEITSAYVSMTIGGLDAHKTATGLRQAMVAFLKPSEDMKKVLKELGYANVDQIIQAKGFMGALQAVSEASGNMSDEIAKSFRNVRALTAELSLTRDEADKYKKAMVAMGEVSADSLDKLYEKLTQMPAEKLTANINALKVTMTRDFGNMMVKVLGDLIELAGGANTLSAALQGLARVAAVVGAALAALAVKALVVQASLGPIGWVLLGITAAFATFFGMQAYHTAQELARIREVAEARREADMKSLRETEEVQRKRREAADEEMKEQNARWIESAATIRRQYNQVLEALKENNQDIVESTRQTLSSMISAQERVVAAYRNTAKAAADAVVASRQRQVTAEADYSDAVFKYSRKNTGAFEKSESYMRRAAWLAREAADAMRAAKTPEQITAALSIFQRAEAASQEAEQIAQGTKNTGLQEDAQRMVLHVMQMKIGAEQTLQGIQAKEAERLAKKAADEQNRLNEMKALMKTILTDLQAFDKEGAKEPKQLAAQGERLNKSISRLRELWLGAERVDISEMMSFDKLQQRIQMALEGGVSQAEVRKLFSTPETFADFRSQIEQGVGPIRILLEATMPKLPERLQKEMRAAPAAERIDILARELARTQEILSQYDDVAVQVGKANDEMSKAQIRSLADLDEWAAVALRPSNLHEIMMARTEKQKRALEDLIVKFVREADRFTQMPIGALREKDFVRLKTVYDEYIEKIKPPVIVQETLKKFMEDAATAASLAEQRAAGIERLRILEPRAEEAQRMRPVLEEAMNAAKAAVDQAEQAIRRAKAEAAAAKGEVTAVSQIDMTNLTTQTNNAAGAMWNLAAASMAVQTPVAPAEIAAMGGRVGRYLAGGGPIGTDVVPAWLTRGEFVMNTEATRRFASQLVAMNAGVQPTFRGEGGSVTNIGDISVSVQGGATGRQTARSIAAELRRELRRRTMKPL
jgi:TP901 family phage tail tape measure protein